MDGALSSTEIACSAVYYPEDQKSVSIVRMLSTTAHLLKGSGTPCTTHASRCSSRRSRTPGLRSLLLHRKRVDDVRLLLLKYFFVANFRDSVAN